MGEARNGSESAAGPIDFSRAETDKIFSELNINRKVITEEQFHAAVNTENHEHWMVTKNRLRDAAQIALDHLLEYPDYYQALEGMEKKLEASWKGRTKPPVFSYLGGTVGWLTRRRVAVILALTVVVIGLLLILPYARRNAPESKKETYVDCARIVAHGRRGRIYRPPWLWRSRVDLDYARAAPQLDTPDRA